MLRTADGDGPQQRAVHAVVGAHQPAADRRRHRPDAEEQLAGDRALQLQGQRQSVVQSDGGKFAATTMNYTGV